MEYTNKAHHKTGREGRGNNTSSRVTRENLKCWALWCTLALYSQPMRLKKYFHSISVLGSLQVTAARRGVLCQGVGTANTSGWCRKWLLQYWCSTDTHEWHPSDGLACCRTLAHQAGRKLGWHHTPRPDNVLCQMFITLNTILADFHSIRFLYFTSSLELVIDWLTTNMLIPSAIYILDCFILMWMSCCAKHCISCWTDYVFLVFSECLEASIHPLLPVHNQ